MTALAQTSIGLKAQFLRAGGYTRRYHGWRLLVPDLVGQHSFNVANLVLLIRPDCPKEVLVAAIQHDVAEHICGDSPSTAKKRVPALKIALDELEDEIFAQHGIENVASGLSPEWHRVLKLADYLDGMMYCVQERAMGNKLVREVYPNFKAYMAKLLYPDMNVVRGPEHVLFEEILTMWSEADD